MFDPAGFLTDAHGENRESIRRSLKPGAVEPAYSCKFHFLQCSERQISKSWSEVSQDKYRKFVKKIVYASTPTAYAVAKTELNWFRSFWEPRKNHVFRAFKKPNTPHVNFAEVGHSKNARGARNQSLAKVAEDHIVECAILNSKIENLRNGTYDGGDVPNQKQRDRANYSTQVRQASKFFAEQASESLNIEEHEAVVNLDPTSSHRASKIVADSSSDECSDNHHTATLPSALRKRSLERVGMLGNVYFHCRADCVKKKPPFLGESVTIAPNIQDLLTPAHQQTIRTLVAG